MAKKKGFKTEWNQFSVFTNELVDEVLCGEGEVDAYITQVTNIETNEKRIQFILSDKRFKDKIEAYVDDLLQKVVPLEMNKLNFARKVLASQGSVDSPYDIYKLIEYYTKGISALYFEDLGESKQQILSQLLWNRAECFQNLGLMREFNLDVLEAQKFRHYSDAPPELGKGNIRAYVAAQESGISVKAGNENPLLECASNHLVMNVDPYKGRFYRSNSFIPPGTVIAVEKAYAAWLRPNFYLSYCHMCLAKLGPRYFFCRNCFKVCFCSIECVTEAWDTFHAFECCYLEILQEWAMGHLAFRVVLVEGVENAMKVADEPPPSAEEWTKLGFKRNYKCIYSLTGEDGVMGTVYFLSCLVGGAIMATFARKVSLIPRDKESYYKFGAILYKHLGQVLINTFLLYDYNLRNSGLANVKLTTEKRKKIGVGLYATSSLFSHSCNNNVAKYYDRSKIVLLNWRSIEPGEEVTLNYGACCFQSTIKDRKSFLYSNFGFDCQCSACQNHMDCLAYAYRCPACAGALIVNDDKTNFCTSCRLEGVNVEQIEKTIAEARNDFSVGRGYLDVKDLVNAKRFLTTAKAKYQSCYYSAARLSQVDLLLSEYYALKFKFWKAYKMCSPTVKINKELYGENSLEVLNILVRCYVLMKREAEENPLYKYKKKKKVQNLTKEGVEMLNKVLGRELNIATDENISCLRYFI